jgi:hypothetical protein
MTLGTFKPVAARRRVSGRALAWGTVSSWCRPRRALPPLVKASHYLVHKLSATSSRPSAISSLKLLQGGSSVPYLIAKR